MTVQVNFECRTVAELHAEMLALLGKNAPTIEDAFARMPRYSGGAETPNPASAPVAEAEPVAEPVKRRGRPPKAAEEAKPVEAVVEASTEEEAPAEEKTDISLDDIKAALAKVRDTKGMEPARNLLGEFNAKKLSELSSDDYAAFLVKAAQYLEG